MAPGRHAEETRATQLTLWRRGTLEWLHAEESFLGHVYALGSAGRSGSAALVGPGGNDSDWCPKLVDRVSQRLVLVLVRSYA